MNVLCFMGFEKRPGQNMKADHLAYNSTSYPRVLHPAVVGEDMLPPVWHELHMLANLFAAGMMK